jgi:hypothetical protein
MPAVRPDAVSQVATPARTVIASSSEIIGSLTGGNLYTNPALGISLQLTGEWEFMDNPTLRMAEGLPTEGTNQAQLKSKCTTPVCGEPEINVGLSTELNPTIGASSVFVTGYKLAPQYLDRKQYPLRMLAEIMLPHSGSGQSAQDSLTDIQLGGRPAYRLLVRQPGEEGPREAGYVVESNGYMVLLVGSTSEAADLPKLQQQIEAAKIK